MALPSKITLAPKALRAFAAKLNGLLAWAEPWERMKVGTGLRFTRAPGGHLLSVDAVQMGAVIAAGGGGGGGGVLLRPFTIYRNGANQISIIAGLLNNLTPTLGGAPLTDAPPPQSSALTDATQLVYLAVTTDADGIATGVTVGIATTLPANTATLAHIQLGQVVVASGSITTITQQRNGSLWHQRCGATEHLFGSAG
jgi:hypothetical protein